MKTPKKPQVQIKVDIDFGSSWQEELREKMFLQLLNQMKREFESRHRKTKVTIKHVKNFTLTKQG